MLLRSYIPGPPLGEFVEQFWLCLDAPAGGRAHILPSGTIELKIDLTGGGIHDPAAHPDRGGGRHAGAVVSGAYDRCFVSEPSQGASVIGVHFRPGGAVPFLGGVPAGELADMHVDLEALWGRQPAAELRDRLGEAATPAQRFALLERTLAARLDRASGRRHDAVPVALGAFERADCPRVRDVARRVGLSQRRFIEVFASEVGLTPKLYGRVRRFRRALAMVRGVPSPDWVRVAAGCGYFDQSHLIRDFRAFAGLTPEEYQSHRRRRGGSDPHDHVMRTG